MLPQEGGALSIRPHEHLPTVANFWALLQQCFFGDAPSVEKAVSLFLVLVIATVRSVVDAKMDTLGIEPEAFRMRSGCDTTTPCARHHTLAPFMF